MCMWGCVRHANVCIFYEAKWGGQVMRTSRLLCIGRKWAFSPVPLRMFSQCVWDTLSLGKMSAVDMHSGGVF
jgi:hypothetical protein